MHPANQSGAAPLPARWASSEPQVYQMSSPSGSWFLPGPLMADSRHMSFLQVLPLSPGIISSPGILVSDGLLEQPEGAVVCLGVVFMLPLFELCTCSTHALLTHVVFYNKSKLKAIRPELQM